MDQPTAEEFQCPGESQPISAAVHYARLSSAHAACRDCAHRQQTGALSKQTVRRLERTWRLLLDGELWNDEGLAGVHLNALTAAVARRAAYALGVHRQQQSAERAAVAVGHDGRTLAADLIQAVSEGLRHSGCDVIEIGSATAGSLSFAVSALSCGGGAYIGNTLGAPHTASLRFWSRDGQPISAGGQLDQIRSHFEQSPGRPRRAAGRLRREHIDESYLATLKDFFHALRPLRVQLETACGPLEQYVSQLSRDVACEFVARPRGEESRNELRHPAPTHLGLQIDGDGEVCQVFDERGSEVPICALLPVLMKHLAAGDSAPDESGAIVVLERGTPESAAEAIGALGGRVVWCEPSREAMSRELIEHNACLGGGPSGRYWFASDRPAADGLALLAHLLTILSQSDRPMSEVVRCVSSAA